MRFRKSILLALILVLFMPGAAAMAAQHDYDISNAPGAAVRADINNALEAIATNNSGATEPAATYANMWWFDTSTNILKQRDNANTDWVSVAYKSGTGWIPYRSGTQIGDVSTLTKDTDGTLAANSDSYVATQKATKTYYDTNTSAKFNTSTGHDHDGTDSKKVVATNLDMTGITNGHYLYNNSGTLAGATVAVPTVKSFFAVGTGGLNTNKYYTLANYEYTGGTNGSPMPCAGTFKNLYLYKSSTYTGSATLVKNGSEQSLTVSVGAGSTSGSDTSNTVAVSAGDFISIKLVGSGGSVMFINATVEFDPS